MGIDFSNIYGHIIPLHEFSLHWRFTDKQYADIPAVHLDQLKPLDSKASAFLWDFILHSGLHDDTPFKKDFFKTIDKAKVDTGNEELLKKWLYHRGLPFDKDVFLSWQPGEAMIVPWKIFIKYFNCFYYSDDLTIIEPGLTWALLFYHESEVYFGTNRDFIPDDTFSDRNFIW